MPGNRAAAEKVVLEYVEKILPGSINTQLYSQQFARMSDDEFDEWIDRLERREIRLAVTAPNLSGPSLSVERNLALAEELGHNFFERLWIDPGNDIPPYLSGVPYLVMDLPLRRQAQLLVKKISIPEDNRSIDDFTGQPTGKSKGSKISYPEIQIMKALGLDYSLTEKLKYRGGDVKGFDAMNDSIAKTGGVSLEAIKKLGTEVQSTRTLRTLLLAMHLSSTL